MASRGYSNTNYGGYGNNGSNYGGTNYGSNGGYRSPRANTNFAGYGNTMTGRGGSGGYRSPRANTQGYNTNRNNGYLSPRANTNNGSRSNGRGRRNRSVVNYEPTSPEECPAGTYFRSATERATLDGGTSYVRATCARYPQNNPWWDAIDRFTDENPGVSGAEAAQILSQSGAYYNGEY